MIGGAGWFVTHFVGSPWLRFKQLQGDVLEVVLFAANVSDRSVTLGKRETRLYYAAVDDLRRTGARVAAYKATIPKFFHVFLQWCGYDLQVPLFGLWHLVPKGRLQDPP